MFTIFEAYWAVNIAVPHIWWVYFNVWSRLTGSYFTGINWVNDCWWIGFPIHNVTFSPCAFSAVQHATLHLFITRGCVRYGTKPTRVDHLRRCESYPCSPLDAPHIVESAERTTRVALAPAQMTYTCRFCTKTNAPHYSIHNNLRTYWSCVPHLNSKHFS